MDTSVILPVNQLKFNLNTVVDNLNLVNVVHQPEAISIDKISMSHFQNFNQTKVNGYGRLNNERNIRFKDEGNKKFEFIDEEKLSMYSFLVQRDLKLKEWMSNFDNGNFTNESNSKVMPEKDTNKSVKSPNSKTDKKTNENKNGEKPSKENNDIKAKPLDMQIAPKSTSELNELKKCCDDSVKAIEHLQKQLNECKLFLIKILE